MLKATTPTGFGRSDLGLGIWEILGHLGMTLEEWGETDIVQRRYYRAAYSEKSDRQEEAQRNAG